MTTIGSWQRPKLLLPTCNEQQVVVLPVLIPGNSLFVLGEGKFTGKTLRRHSLAMNSPDYSLLHALISRRLCAGIFAFSHLTYEKAQNWSPRVKMVETF